MEDALPTLSMTQGFSFRAFSLASSLSRTLSKAAKNTAIASLLLSIPARSGNLSRNFSDRVLTVSTTLAQTSRDFKTHIMASVVGVSIGLQSKKCSSSSVSGRSFTNFFSHDTAAHPDEIGVAGTLDVDLVADVDLDTAGECGAEEATAARASKASAPLAEPTNLENGFSLGVRLIFLRKTSFLVLGVWKPCWSEIRRFLCGERSGVETCSGAEGWPRTCGGVFGGE